MPRFVALALGASFLVGCSSSVVATAPDRSLAALAPTVSVAEAAALRDDGALIVDVRELDEWAAGHIPGATLIPLGELPSRQGELARDQPIVVVCRSGNRSAEGRDILLAAGFEAVTSVQGGMTDWTTAGLPVETGG